jgi:transcription elongation factor GreA
VLNRALPFLCTGDLEMIEELKRKMAAEVEKLQHELNVTLPNEIRKAVEHGDLRENSEYKAALERQQFVQARLGQLHTRLSKLASIDMAQIPPDKVGLGSKVVVEDEKTKAREEYHMVFGDAIELEDNHVTMSSPIGRTLLGKSVGESFVLRLPNSTRKLRLVELHTIHDDVTA